MLFSMITYQFKLLRNPHAIVVAALKFYSSFGPNFQLFFLEQFCDLQLKRNEFFLILCIRITTHPYICTTNPPIHKSLVRAELLSTPMLFASLHNFIFCYSTITRIAAFPALFVPPPPPHPLSIITDTSLKVTPL